jgi:hypothetical protein
MKYTPDARALPREHVCLSARIARNNGSPSLACVIRNFSTAGANLILGADEYLPAEFDLQIPLRNTTYRVALIWRNEEGCGVKFLRKHQHAPSRLTAFV